MATTLPVAFRSSPEAIATYPYTDIKDGTGVVTFYGARISIDATAGNDKYILTTDSTLIPSTDETELVSADVDFDVTFLIPKTIEGEMTFNIPHFVVGTTQNGQVKVTVIHWDGTTETTLVAQTDCPLRQNVTNARFDNSLKVTVPLTSFKKGETLRITVWGEGTASHRISHVPLGSDTNYTVSGGRMTFQVPFLLDL